MPFSKDSPIRLGPRRLLKPFVEHGSDDVVGFIEEHPSAKRPLEQCYGTVWIVARPNRPTWTVVSEDPITLTPSILCRSCGEHGWVRDGKWVPA